MSFIINAIQNAVTKQNIKQLKHFSGDIRTYVFDILINNYSVCLNDIRRDISQKFPMLVGNDTNNDNATNNQCYEILPSLKNKILETYVYPNKFLLRELLNYNHSTIMYSSIDDPDIVLDWLKHIDKDNNYSMYALTEIRSLNDKYIKQACYYNNMVFFSLSNTYKTMDLLLYSFQNCEFNEEKYDEDEDDDIDYYIKDYHYLKYGDCCKNIGMSQSGPLYAPTISAQLTQDDWILLMHTNYIIYKYSLFPQNLIDIGLINILKINKIFRTSTVPYSCQFNKQHIEHWEGKKYSYHAQYHDITIIIN